MRSDNVAGAAGCGRGSWAPPRLAGATSRSRGRAERWAVGRSAGCAQGARAADI